MSPSKKILALHGVAQSGPVFARRCQNIATHLAPLGYQVIFLTAPHSIEGTAYTVARQADWQPGDEERSWWTTDDDGESHPSIAFFLHTVSKCIKDEGPFVAVMGFSQGGCAAASVASLLEPSRRQSPLARRYLGEDVLSLQPPLDFLVLFSANPYRFPLSPRNDVDVQPLFYPGNFTGYPYEKLSVPTRETLTRSSGKYTESPQTASSIYADHYLQSVATPRDNMLSTPTLAFYGQKEWDLDAFSRGRQQWFISRFKDVQVQPHTWKHTVPRTDEYAEIVVDFVKRIESRGEKPAKASL